MGPGALGRLHPAETVTLFDWEAASAPSDADRGALEWAPAQPPLAEDGRDWWFRTRFVAEPTTPGEEVVLRFGGIATVYEVLLNGTSVVTSESMFVEHALDVGMFLRGRNELVIHCHALEPLLAVRRKPRARWRTKLVDDGNLRFFRTTLLGRAPGFAPGPAPIGPWRPVRLERRRALALDELSLRPRIEGEDGVLAVRARLRPLADGSRPELVELEVGGRSEKLAVDAEGDALVATGEARLPAVERWWPHTHGAPRLHDVRLVASVDGERIVLAERRTGFRELETAADLEADGLGLRVNDVPVFARGALWTPVEDHELRPTLERMVTGGMNMVRLPGTGVYETGAFHDLCDELGILVWQDFMFANMDYPVADEAFRASVEAEARQALAGVAGRPSLAVLCGNSEVEQQVAMLGLDPEMGRGELFGELLPALVRESGADAPYVPSAPCGGDLPFRPGRGVANYFGVGGYRRPLDDARRAGVKFASECLAFANVPDADPAPKQGVPRDVGASWDFEDVRDHYLELLFGTPPEDLRSFDQRRYLELSRAVSGEVMAEVFGEWRRAASPCGGGLILWLRDIAPGSGWGLLDHTGAPKVVFHHLRRALAPVAVWTIDEGLAGVAVHVANDTGEALMARLRVALYRDGEHRIEEAAEEIELPPHGSLETNVEAMLGHFVDAAWAYRFGPPQQDVIVASLEPAEGGEPISQAFRFPAVRPAAADPAARLGVEASAWTRQDGTVQVAVRSRRLAYGVRLRMAGYEPDDDSFSIEPGRERTVTLRPAEPRPGDPAGTVTALNMAGSVPISFTA